METITIEVRREDVYEEVAKATDYTGAKLVGADADARDRILAGDEDLITLSRLWDEAALVCNENFKEMTTGPLNFISLALNEYDERSRILANSGHNQDGGDNPGEDYRITLEVSKAFDKGLAGSVEAAVRSFFIASIIGGWFVFANKGEAAAYFAQAGDVLKSAERMLYSRRRPGKPTFG